MKEPSRSLGQSDLNKRKLHKVIMQTAEQASTQENTGKMVKIIDSIYTK